MNTAGDRSFEPHRNPLSGLNFFLLDVGYILLIIGCTLLLLAAFPDPHPLLPVGFLFLSALILLPARNWIRRRIQNIPIDRESRSAWESKGFAGEDPTADPRDFLLRLSQILHSTSDLDVLLELIFSQTILLVPAQSFRIALAEEEAGFISYAFYFEDGLRRAERERIPFPMKEDLAGEVISTGRQLMAEEYSQACRSRNLPEREPYPAWAGLPLQSGASVIGAMLLMRESPFTEKEQSLLESVAVIAGPAIAKTKLDRESNRQTALLTALLRASRRIIGIADREGMPDAILSGARELLSCQSAFLFLPDTSGGWKVEGHSPPTGTPGNFPAIGAEHPFTKLLTGDHPTFIDRLPEEDPFSLIMQPGAAAFRCAVSLPLRRKEKIFGWVVFWNPTAAAPPPPAEELLLHEFAAISVAALESSRLLDTADFSSATVADELTSLQHLDQELNSASDPSGAMSITLDWAIRYTEAPAGLAALCAPEAFEVAAVSGYPEKMGPEEKNRLPLESPGFAEALQSGTSVRLNAQGSIPPGLLPSGKTALFVPIRRNAQSLGVLLLESDIEDAFPPTQVDFLGRLASRAAVAISNAQLYAEVRNANQAKSEFISFVAHELKTPMTSIRGYTDLVAQGAVGPVSQPQANFLATIRLNVDRMAALVSDLNDVSRIESGRLRLEFGSVALAPALDEVLEALRSQIESKEQRLTLQIPPDLPPAWVDRGRLIQILTNLVSNAYKYTPNGGALRIAAERSPNRWDPVGPPEVVHFLIQDSGLGISPQEQKNIYQKFFRSEDGIVRDTPGTGLGLHITRNLVEMHGGRIWFESEIRKGSTFHFTVPTSSI